MTGEATFPYVSYYFADVIAVITATAGQNLTKIEIGPTTNTLTDYAKLHQNRLIFTRISAELSLRFEKKLSMKNRNFDDVFAVITATAGRNLAEIALRLFINTFSDRAKRH
jgi:hypothetical protein